MSVWDKLCEGKVYYSAKASFAGTEIEFDKSKEGKCVWRVLGSGVPIISEDEVTCRIAGNSVVIIVKNEELKFEYDAEKNVLKGEKQGFTFTQRNLY